MNIGDVIQTHRSAEIGTVLEIVPDPIRPMSRVRILTERGERWTTVYNAMDDLDFYAVPC